MDLTLDRALEVAQTRESSERQARDIAQSTASLVYATFNHPNKQAVQNIKINTTKLTATTTHYDLMHTLWHSGTYRG